jgi:putative copper export protein
MTLTTLNNFLHLLTTTSWIGGMIYINIILIPSLTAIDPPQRGKLLSAATKRFGILASTSIIILIVTGIFKTPSQMLFNFSSTFGIALTVKHLVIVAMVVIGLLIMFRLGPKMQASSPSPGEQPGPQYLKLQSQISILSRVNMVLGVVVLILAAIIT